MSLPDGFRQTHHDWKAPLTLKDKAGFLPTDRRLDQIKNTGNIQAVAENRIAHPPGILFIFLCQEKLGKNFFEFLHEEYLVVLSYSLQ